MSIQVKLVPDIIPDGDRFEYVAEKLMLHYFRAIRRRMREEGISQTVLAERLGVSQAYISKMLKYNQNLTIRSLAILAEVMDVEWDFPRLIAKTQEKDGKGLADSTHNIPASIPIIEESQEPVVNRSAVKPARRRQHAEKMQH